METNRHYPSDVAFTDAVKAVQLRNGSRDAYVRMERSGSWETEITPELAQFIEARTSAFIATANAAGQPYIQHRGGPAGFLHVLDERTIAFADFVGNRQYITQGNLGENPNVHLFLIDYARRRRIKIWGTAKVVEHDEALMKKLMPEGYRARAAQAIVFTVAAWDENCPQHIPQLIDARDVAATLESRDLRIAELEAALKALRAKSADLASGPT